MLPAALRTSYAPRKAQPRLDGREVALVARHLPFQRLLGRLQAPALLHLELFRQRPFANAKGREVPQHRCKRQRKTEELIGGLPGKESRRVSAQSRLGSSACPYQ